MNDSDANSSPLMLPKSDAQAHQHQQQQQYSTSTTTTSALSSAGSTVNQNQQQTAANLPTTTVTTSSPLLVNQEARNHDAIMNNNNIDTNNTQMLESSMSSSTSPFLPPAQAPLREGINASSSSSFTTTLLSPITTTILDAPILDDYLLGHVLLSKLRRIAMELFDSNNSNIDSDDHTLSVIRRYGTLLVSLLLYPAVHLATTLTTQGQTPAVRILGLERKNVNKNDISLQRQRRQEQQRLILFSLCTTLGPVILHAVKDALIRLQQQYQQRQHQRQLQVLVAAASTSHHHHYPQQQQTQLSVQQEYLAAYRQFQMATHVLQILNRIIPLVQLALVLNCWKSTSNSNNATTHFYNTSELAMLLTGFTYQKQIQQQESSEAQAPLTVAVEPPTLLHVTYAHRRWLWDEMARTAQLWTRGLTMLIPIWKPLLKRYFQYWRQCCLIMILATSKRKISTKMSSGKVEEGSSVDNQQEQLPCPICHAQPITVPVTTDCCGRAYCYVCLYQESMISSSYSSFGHNYVPSCRICGQSISHCQRKKS